MTDDHIHVSDHRGPDIPRVYGSSRSQVCKCGAWRMVTHHDEPMLGWNWRTDDINEAAKPRED